LRRVEVAGISVARGDELGAFRLGSTVALALPPGAVRELACASDQVVRMGQRLALLGGRA
jgi:hypothetical protein